MKKKKGNCFVTKATIFALQISEGKSEREIALLKCFFNQVCNTLQSIQCVRIHDDGDNDLDDDNLRNK